MSQIHYDEGVLAEQKGDKTAAIAAYERAPTENPAFQEAITALGRLQFVAPEQPFLDHVRPLLTGKKVAEIVMEVRNPCNYRCFYCVAKGSNNEPVQQFDLKAIEKIYAEVDAEYIVTSLECGGGEPTVHPQFAELARLCSKYGLISFPSNNSQNPERWLPKDTASRLNIRSSLHPEAEEKLETYLRYARYLLDAGVNFETTYIAHPDRIAKIPEYRRLFADQGISFTPVSFIGEHEGKRYPPAHTKEEKETIGLEEEVRFWGQKIEPHTTRIRNFRGIPCLAGSQSLYISSKGALRRCLYDGKPIEKPYAGAEPCRVKKCGCGLALEKLNIYDTGDYYNWTSALGHPPLDVDPANRVSKSLGYDNIQDALAAEQAKMYDTLMAAYGKDKFPEAS